MKLTSTLRSLAAGTAVLALSAWGISALVQTDSTTFSPRPEAAAAQPDGAMEIRRMLVGDANGNIDHEGLQELRRAVAKAASKQARAWWQEGSCFGEVRAWVCLSCPGACGFSKDGP